jgi:hypothetical protein
MQESRLLGTLLPSSPDFLPIVRQLRKKYGLPELAPGDDPINETFLDGRPVALEDLWQEIKTLAEAQIEFLPPGLGKLVSQARAFERAPVNMVTVDLLPDDYKNGINQLFTMGRQRRSRRGSGKLGK